MHLYMKKIKFNSIIKFVLSIKLVLFSFLMNAQDGQLSVVANPKGCPSEIKFNDLKSILMGDKQRWQDGTKLVIALMKTNTEVGANTSKKIYGMTGDELNKYWLALVFQGKAKAPQFFNSLNDLEAFINQTPGAIGIVESAESIPNRTVLVDGRKKF